MRLLFIILMMSFILPLFGQDICINEFMSKNTGIIADEDGDFSDWIELYNKSGSTFNLTGYALSDDPEDPGKWMFPDIDIESGDFLLIFASGKNRLSPILHSNFKISSEGEPILLSDASGTLIDSIGPVFLLSDQSYGRTEDGGGDLAVFWVPTPYGSNNNQPFEKEIDFSSESGFYNEPFYLKLNCEDTIYFSMDGSEPTLMSELFKDSVYISGGYENRISLIPTNPVIFAGNNVMNQEFGWNAPSGKIDKVCIIKARSFSNGVPSSIVYSQVYFTDRNQYNFPVFSLSTDSLHLFDYQSGIYVPGINLVQEDPVWTGNYYQRGINWEKPGHLHFFDVNGELQVSQGIGFRIHGQKSRVAPQKSFRLYARNEFGKSDIQFPFFNGRDNDQYKRLILRSSYTYWWQRNTLFQDDLIHGFIANKVPGLDVQLSVPAILFINGEYWGIQNLRERQDKYYFASNHGVHPDSVDIIEGSLLVEEGSADDFIQLLKYVAGHDMSVQANYEQLGQFIDIENYMDYLIMEMYFGNIDWPANNIKMWKSHEPGSKWRWLIYDMDASMNDYFSNPFKQVYEANIPSLFFREILESEVFREVFVDRFTYHLNNTFIPEKLSEMINTFEAIYKPEIEKHTRRWGNPKNITIWKTNIESLHEFVQNRACALKYQLIDFFDLDSFEYVCTSDSGQGLLALFPNPCNELLNISIETGNFDQGNMSIVDVSGRIIGEKIIEGNIEKIDTQFLPNGI